MRSIPMLFLLATACATDVDLDGFSSEVDCDDNDNTVHPGAIERCNGVDDNCDGQVDVGAPGAVMFFADADGDGFGDSVNAVLACDVPADHSEIPGDCDDNDAGIFPMSPEFCDGRDTDCNGLIDDGAGDATTYWVDGDGDGHGDLARPIQACAMPLGTATSSDDCDDTRNDSHPGASEWCNGHDDNCDGTVDDSSALDALVWFTDGDADGFGTGVGWLACASAGDSLLASDCDDGAGNVFPGQVEICNGVDDNCDSVVDVDAVDGLWAYEDLDGDGYGDAARQAWVCAVPLGSVANADDCDDYNANNHPLAEERCDGVDNNCDTVVDDATSVDQSYWFADGDGDGWGDTSTAYLSCNGAPNTVSVGWDCDDGNVDISPVATEDCSDNLDNNCNGGVDDCGVGGSPVTSWEFDDLADAWLMGHDGAWAGYTGDVVGDVDGDGYDDMIIGTQSYSSGNKYRNGAVWLIYGGPNVASESLELHPKWVGVESNDELGNNLAGIGDIDGDGLADIAIQATQGGTVDYGAVYIVYGSTTRFSGQQSITAVASAYINNSTTRTRFGEALSPAGDVDGDGYDDFVFGHPDHLTAADEYRGAVYMMYGGPSRYTGVVNIASLPRFLGRPFDYIGQENGLTYGDFDGDGFSDVVVGANGSNNQRVYVVYGGGQRLPVGDNLIGGSPGFTMNLDDQNNTYFGRHNTGIGDLNGDGYGDLAMAIPDWDALNSSDGIIMVKFGGASRWSGVSDIELNADFTVTGMSNESIGRQIARNGDLNGDGFADLVFGGSGWSGGRWENAGAVFVYYGHPAISGISLAKDASLILEGSAEGAGIAISLSLGDVDGDGVSDIWATTYRSAGDGGLGRLLYGTSLLP